LSLAAGQEQAELSPTMRIAFFTLGTRGDIQPLVALAKGFADAGHDVLFVSDESARALVLPHGIPGHFLPGNLQERLAERRDAPERLARDPYRLARHLTGAFADLLPVWMPEAAAAMQGCRLLIMWRSSFGIGYGLAEKIRAIPCEAAFAPSAASRYLPSSLLPWPSLPVPGEVKRLLHAAAVRAGWLGARDAVNASRSALGLPEISWPFGRGRSGLLSSIPELYGFSPTLFPRPPDWPDNITVTGFWQHRPDAAWEPPPALARFLETGPKPVYVGFGSVVDRRPQELQEIVRRSVRALGLRAIVSTGWGGMAGFGNSDDMHVIGDVPHDWLFPRVAAVVHHGGAGTVGAVLRAGVPSVIVPYAVDHPFWGWVLERRGVAPRMIPRSRLSERRLTGALRQATGDEVMRQRAAELGVLVRAEDGVRRAVAVIEAWLSPTLAGTAPVRIPVGAAVQKPT
jgi:UDP:flavonoid glycosyltransferase YjiC (YdhE family)